MNYPEDLLKTPAPTRLCASPARSFAFPQPRPELAHVPVVPHGGHHSGLPSGDLLDFSDNINPFGPSPRIWPAMQSVAIARHPDPRATPLRHALAVHNQVEPAALLVGNGAVDLIYQLCVAYLRPGDRVLIVAPTFGEYAAASTVMGAEVVLHHLQRHPTRFTLDLDKLLAEMQRLRPRLLFLCNPNNPTGTYHDRAVVETLLAHYPDTLLVLDEAFVSFVATPWHSHDLLEYANLLILRSLTKDYALTGLRVGYAMAAPEIIAALEKVQPPWSVNALAQAATLAALADQEHLQATLASLDVARDDLVRNLTNLGLAPLDSSVHFFLVPVQDATHCQRMLVSHGILVRDATSSGLPDCIRIAARQSAENAQLLAAIANVKIADGR